MLNPGDIASYTMEYEFIQGELKVMFGCIQNLFSTDEKVLVLLTEKMTLINMHQCYVRPYTGSVS